MISQPQHKTLASLLFQRLPSPVDGQTVVGYLSEEVAFQLPSSTKNYITATWIIDQLLRQATPDRFVALVRVVDDQQAGMASLTKLADELEATPALWQPLGAAPAIDWAIDSDPLAIGDGRPFVDRVGFRSLLPRRGAADSPSCVLVTGDTGDGKSYLSDFCSAFAEGRDDLRIAYANAGANPQHLVPRIPATTLALRLGVDFEAEPVEHEELFRDAENLASWIVHYSPKRDIPAVIILDEFGREGVSEPVHKFIAMLVRSIQQDEAVRAKLRVILIDYDRSRLITEKLEHELYVLEAVEPAHVADWFRRCFPNHPDYRYDSTAQSIVTQVAALERSQRMRTINLKMQVAGQKFARPLAPPA